jgi:hypothetical protein
MDVSFTESVDDGTSLYSVMSRYDYAASFLPLFANLNVAPEALPGVVLGIMQQLPDWDPGYFGIVRQYLFKYSLQHLNYSLYIGFFSLFSSVPGDVLFDSLILVTDLWSQSPPDCFRRVIRHWSAIAVNACSAIFQQPLFFTRLVKLFHTLFFDKSDRLNGCRSAFISLLEEIGKTNFVTQDAGYLFQTAYSATDPRLSVECLRLMERFSAQMLTVPGIIDFLNFFVSSKNIDVAVAAICTIHTLAHSQLLYRMGIVSCQFHGDCAIFDALLQLFPRYIGFVHLLAILALSLDQSTKQRLVNAVSETELDEHSVCLLREKFWFFWIFLLATQLNPDSVTKLVFFVAEVLRCNSDFANSLDDLIDVVQIFSALIDFDTSALILELFLAANAISFDDDGVLLNRCMRVMFFRFTCCSRNSTLLELMSRSPFPVDFDWFRKPPLELTALDSVLELMTQDFTNYRTVYGVAPGGESLTILRFCLQHSETIRCPLDRYQLQLSYIQSLAARSTRSIAESHQLFEYLNKAVPELQAANEMILTNRMQNCICQLRTVLHEIQSASVMAFERIDRAVSEFSTAVQHVRILPDLPSVETVDRYIRHLGRNIGLSPEKVISRYACRSFIPFKLKFLEDLSSNRLFLIDQQRDSRAAGRSILKSGSQQIALVSQATLWEFNYPKKVLVVIDDNSIEISQTRKVFGRLAFSDIITVKHQRDECLEFFTYRLGSFYLDFSPTPHSRVISMITSSGWKPNDSLLIAKKMTNFDYLVMLEMLSGKSFHFFQDQPMIPLPPDLEREVPAIDFCLPEFNGQPLSHAYDVRIGIERLAIDEYAKNRYGDVFVHRIPETPSCLLTCEMFRNLEFDADDEVESGDFCDPETVWLKMKSGRVLFHGVFDKISESVQPETNGVYVSAGESFVIFDTSGRIEFLNPFSDRPSVVMRLNSLLNFVRVSGNRLFFVADQCLICSSKIEQPTTYSIIAISRSRICAFDASHHCNTLAIGTDDCIVNVYTISNGELNCVIDLDSLEPENVLVTPSWGMIVVLTHSDILVYSVNGTFVGKFGVDRGIRHWKAFSNFVGFDYAVFIDDGNRIGIFEAMKPSDVQYLKSPAYRHNVIAAGYMNRRRAVVGLTKEGKVTLTPFESGHTAAA